MSVRCSRAAEDLVAAGCFGLHQAVAGKELTKKDDEKVLSVVREELDQKTNG